MTAKPPADALTDALKWLYAHMPDCRCDDDDTGCPVYEWGDVRAAIERAIKALPVEIARAPLLAAEHEAVGAILRLWGIGDTDRLNHAIAALRSAHDAAKEGK